MPIVIRKGGVPLTTVQGTKPAPVPAAPVQARAVVSSAPRPQSPPQRSSAPPEPRRPNEVPAGFYGAAPACPIDATVSAATLAKWQKFPAPNAKPKPCAFCGQHYIRPCSDAEKIGCSNYAYARQYGVKQEPAHGVA